MRLPRVSFASIADFSLRRHGLFFKVSNGSVRNDKEGGYSAGATAPVATHALNCFTNSACFSGGSVRPSPGFQPHNTNESLDTW